VQDRGVLQDCIEEIKNPAEQIIANQVDKASSWWGDFDIESESSLIPAAVMAGAKGDHPTEGKGMPSSSTTSASKPKAKAKAKAAAKATTPATLLCFAAKQRAKTTKDFAEAERMLQRAHEKAEDILTVTAPKILGAEDCDDDPSLALLKKRLMIVKQGMDTAGGAESKVASEKLYDLAMQDPYLRDLQMTMFADPDSVQTIGALRHARHVTIDLCHGKT
jgi:hypothetical protein